MWQLRHYPGVQENLGMDFETRHGPHKSSKVREGVEGQFSWVALALSPVLEHSLCNYG